MHPQDSSPVAPVVHPSRSRRRSRRQVCDQCGAEFEPRGRHPQTYCSPRCAYAARRKMRPCDSCGTVYRVHNGGRRYCSVACRDAARRTRVTLACQSCGKAVERKPASLKGHVYCSPACCGADRAGKPSQHRRPQGRARRVGGVIDRGGYRYLWMPEHPMANGRGYVAEHRLIMSVVLGRLLTSADQVHHISGDRRDNRPENLQLLSKSAHAALHRSQERALFGWAAHGCCSACGTTERRYAAHGLCLRCYGRLKQREYSAAKRRP